MAPKHHPTPLSGGDRKALAKTGGMTGFLAKRSGRCTFATAPVAFRIAWPDLRASLRPA